MALLKFTDAYPDSRVVFGDEHSDDFDDYSVYASDDDKVGSVKDALFEDMSGSIRYLIVDTGFWFLGKDVLLPIGLARFDHKKTRVYVDGLTKEQVEELPEYEDGMTIDRDYEDRLNDRYRALGSSRRQFMGREFAYGSEPATSSDRYDYSRDPNLFTMDKDAHEPIRLYQERLIADKDRFKSGEIAISKRVETETEHVSVPVEKERIVIERSQPSSSTPVAGTPDFKAGEVARMETYAEEANIRKEAFVREEVSVRKEVDREMVNGQETLRREELDVETEGTPELSRR